MNLKVIVLLYFICNQSVARSRNGKIPSMVQKFAAGTKRIIKGEVALFF